ncbi:uncharacterized protein B0J16DRAFT_199755 [Fusarium flagelliforme]|uniref:uncharacterized protein n=1 Tax=Fusarium flagelliforme TaxID=2675880 RepID=UPI001E8E57BA|nr:uncharacterized protein B0J16DRAFT_199755 [Fusarium flagelliforme]KAH7174053.1 hypothetical protein B0J16DRAFT_199755 [Fusarium flagelliforme]
MTTDLARRYLHSMKHHPYGNALFEPAPFSRLQPGSLGYLDELQRWHPILNLLDSEALEKAGYSPLGELRPSEPDVRRFGPMLSNKTSKTNVDLEAGVGAAAMGLPVDVSGAVKYSTSNEFGAVLVCENDVVSEGFDLRQPFATWLEQNAKSLFKDYPDAKRLGLYAVTWTYSSTDIHISAWDGESNDATVGFKVGFAGAGNVGPQTSWVRGQSSSGWSEWTDQKRVLFFTGVFMRTNLFGWAKMKKSSLPKGTTRFNVEGEEGEQNFKAFLEPVGDIDKAKAGSTDETVISTQGAS